MEEGETNEKKQTNKTPKKSNTESIEQLDEGEPRKKNKHKIPKKINTETTERLDEGEPKLKKQAKPKKSNTEATELIEKRKTKMEIKPVEQIQCKVGTIYIEF